MFTEIWCPYAFFIPDKLVSEDYVFQTCLASTDDFSSEGIDQCYFLSFSKIPINLTIKHKITLAQLVYGMISIRQGQS